MMKMDLIYFLQELIIKGWKFWISEEKIHYDAPNEANSKILNKLKENKTDIIKLLRDSPDFFNVLPLSSGQKSLWFLWQLDPMSSAYNIVFATRICDNLDIEVLRLAWQKLYNRHPSLRSTFPKCGEEPIQQLHNNLSVDFKLIDASGQNEAELKSSVYQESQRPFDLEHEPVMRVRLFTRSEKEHILLLTIHHIAADGWSLNILVSELGQLYQAEKNSTPTLLPNLEYRYSDFVDYQNKILESSRGKKLEKFWLEQLKGELPILNLPTDKPRPPIKTYNGACHQFYLSPQLSEKLQNLVSSSNTTLFMTLLAAFEVLLYRYSGQEDILVGSPISGRLQQQFRKIVGYFVNSVVIRGNLAHNPSFESFLRQISCTVQQAIVHQDYPFLLLVEKLLPHRDASRSPIFQAFFSLQQPQHTQTPELFGNEEKEADWGGLKLRAFPVTNQEAQFDLDLEILEGSSHISGIFKYNTDLFHRATIERMTAHYQNVLEAIVENPQQAVSEIPILSTAECHQLLTEWNDTAVEYPRDKCIHHLFESQVEQTPNDLAVVFEDQQLTYQQLNQKANQLAHHLQNLGVREEVLVGICLERSLEMVVGLLAILKSGGAYVPLDQNYPLSRLSHMLSDSNVEVLITQSSLLESLPEHQAEIVCLDTDEQVIKQYENNNLETKVYSNNLAYVLYTSGSTGVPKGIAMNHAPLVNLILWQLQQSSAKCGTKTGQFSAISFDVSLQEILSTLCSSGVLVIIPEDVRRDGTELLKLLVRQEIERLFLPFVALEQLAQSARNSKLIPFNLRELITAGEQLKITPAIAEFLDKLPNCRLENHYGPTETHVVTAFVLEKLPNYHQLLPPIGRPINNTKILILDEYLQLVPIGVAGEIYIGGDGLARGYLNGPKLTQEKFIPNPFDNSLSEQLYKTGDIARYLPDGNIEFLGRIDNQVKIRGFRVELGEIESVLNNHPHIKQTVVIATERHGQNRRLVAYVVTEDKSLSVIQLREFIKQKLPSYMVPSAFILLDSLPLTPNGKVDRKALPAPDGLMIREQEYVAPRNTVEQILVEIWQELLGLQKVGVHDNFFELGGDSLLAIQVVNRAKQQDQVLQLKQIFQHQTIEELASVVNTTEVVKAQQIQISGVVPLLPAQKNMLAINTTHHNLIYLNGFILESSLELNPHLLEKAIHHLFIYHDALRSRFIKTPEGWQQQHVETEENIVFHHFDLSEFSQEEQKQEINRQAAKIKKSINLSDGPLAKFILFKLGETQNNKLLIIIHHLVYDFVSLNILFEDLSIVYKQLISGELIQLPPKSTSVKFWAERLSEYAHSEDIQQESMYWLEMCRKYDYRLPIDNFKDQDNQPDTWIQPVVASLNIEETRILLQKVTLKFHTRLTHIFLTALVLTFMKWTGKYNLLVRILSHGRDSKFEDVNLSRTVGWLTQWFPILLDIEATQSIENMFHRIREQLELIPNYGLGYSVLINMCKNTDFIEKLQSLSADPEVYFNFEGQYNPSPSNSSLFRVSEEFIKISDRALKPNRKFIKLNILIMKGKLQLRWESNNDYYRRSTIENLSQNYKNVLHTFIDKTMI